MLAASEAKSAGANGHQQKSGRPRTTNKKPRNVTAEISQNPVHVEWMHRINKARSVWVRWSLEGDERVKLNLPAGSSFSDKAVKFCLGYLAPTDCKDVTTPLEESNSYDVRSVLAPVECALNITL